VSLVRGYRLRALYCVSYAQKCKYAHKMSPPTVVHEKDKGLRRVVSPYIAFSTRRRRPNGSSLAKTVETALEAPPSTCSQL
jgi:hypothetical protein